MTSVSHTLVYLWQPTTNWLFYFWPCCFSLPCVTVVFLSAWGFFSRAVLNALKCVGIAALGEDIMYSKATSKLLSKINRVSRVMQLPVVTKTTHKTVIHASVFNDERCMLHVILTLYTLPLPFQERRQVCSSVPFPKRQSAAVWGSSRSSSHWAATVSCSNSPHLQVRTDTDLSLLWSVSFHLFHICVVFMFCVRLSVLL